MTDEIIEQTPPSNSIASGVTYVAEKLTDNVAFFACLGFGMALVWFGYDVPEWLIAIVGLGANKYLKT